MKWMGGARQRLKIHERGAKRRLYSHQPESGRIGHSAERMNPRGLPLPQKKRSRENEVSTSNGHSFKRMHSEKVDFAETKDLAFLQFATTTSYLPSSQQNSQQERSNGQLKTVSGNGGTDDLQIHIPRLNPRADPFRRTPEVTPTEVESNNAALTPTDDENDESRLQAPKEFTPQQPILFIDAQSPGKQDDYEATQQKQSKLNQIEHVVHAGEQLLGHLRNSSSNNYSEGRLAEMKAVLQNTARCLLQPSAERIPALEQNVYTILGIVEEIFQLTKDPWFSHLQEKINQVFAHDSMESPEADIQALITPTL